MVIPRTITLDPQVWEKLKEEAKDNGLSLSTYINFFFMQKYKFKKSQKPKKVKEGK